MSNEIDKQADKIFQAALEIEPSDKRAAFITEACANSPELQQKVDQLLKASQDTSKPKQVPDELDTSQHSDELTTDFDPNRTFIPSRLKAGQLGSPKAEILPREFGDYVLTEQIAHGGMGVVYKGTQVSLQRTVAIKMLRMGELAGPEEISRFKTEAEAAASLDHPGIVPVFEVGFQQSQHFFSMGYVEGNSLADEIKKRTFAPREAATYARKIAEASQYAHDRGILHRDLKPGNVLLDESRNPRITDFGLAKKVEVESNLTMSGMIIGTPAYMPPEQASGEVENIDARADVYSIGATLYAMLTGHPPFQGKSELQTIMRVIDNQPRPPRFERKDVHRDLEAICLKCLEKAPADRYQSAQDLADDLGRFLAGEPIHAKSDWYRRIRRWTLTEPVLAAHLAAIVAMMAVVFLNYCLAIDPVESFRLLIVNQAILASWAVAAIIMQKVHNAVQNQNFIPLVWAATNPVFLSAAFAVNDPPHTAFSSIYILGLIIVCFFRRVEMVSVSAVSTLISYVTLLGLFLQQELEHTPKEHIVVSVLTIIVAAVLCIFLTLRLKRLSENTETK